MVSQTHFARAPGRLEAASAPEGAYGLVIAQAARTRGGVILHVARDAARAAALREGLAFFAPDLAVIDLPAWDCLPYDRVSPSIDVASRRVAALSFLAHHTPSEDAPVIVITTANAVVQRVPPKSVIANTSFAAKPGGVLNVDRLTEYLTENGYARASTVREPGEFAIRGGLIDVFPPGAASPSRLDLFGDTLESIRTFDPETQRTIAQARELNLAPVSEVLLNADSISRFRRHYVAAFGAATDNDPLYEAVSAHRKHHGVEHWTPFFYEEMDTLFDYLGEGALVFLDHLCEQAAAERLSAVADHYATRAEDGAGGGGRAFAAAPYKPIEPKALYFEQAEWDAALAAMDVRPFSPFAAPEGARAYDVGFKPGRSFAAERAQNANVFDAAAGHIKGLQAEGLPVAISAWTQGSADRMASVLGDHGVSRIEPAADLAAFQVLPKGTVGAVVLGLEEGFVTPDFAVISEQDILGDRMVRRTRKRKADNFLTEASSLSSGDLIVHVEHGVGRYAGLKAIDVMGAPHDCLELHYHGGDKLFLPVENIDLLTRYGSDSPDTLLDKLGGAGWQSRKARAKARIREMADALIKIAAARELKRADKINPPAGAYDEFCARFPYDETEDQQDAIEDILTDLTTGRPMDRLICGDVGFGKTEVALRAAFVAAMSGRQVAVVAPTTLLVRQHYKTFTERFAGFPLKIGQLSRLVSSAEASKTREELREGTLDIVIGTHAVLAKSVSMKNLGMIIIDEEQHFGVKHKERLKELRADVHVLTLTATPIPRTLQLAMSGIRDLSIIATPPVDRLAVRTTVGPFDPVVAREALLREHYRGGQTFYVVPRISDLEEVAEFVKEVVPEVKAVTAHGQMAPGVLEDVMIALRRQI